MRTIKPKLWLTVGLAIFVTGLVVISFDQNKPQQSIKEVLATTDSTKADVDGDGDIDFDDLKILLHNILTGDFPSDQNGDGKVNILDFGNWVKDLLESRASPLPSRLPSPFPSPSLGASPSPAPSPSSIDVYGVFALVPKDQVTNATLIRSEIARVKALGVNFVGQIFAGNSTETQWRTFADLIQEGGMKFVPFIRDETPVFNTATGHWDLGVHGRFIDAMKNHPALYGVFVFDEPHRHGIVASRIAILYQDAKARALEPPNPVNLKIGIGYSGEIWRAETNQYGQNNDEFRFRPGLCDLCMISGLEFRIEGGNHVYQRQDALDNQYYSRIAIAREAPGVELFSTVQTFGREGTTYYLPTPSELQDIIDIVLSDQNQNIKKLDGIIYQTWEAPEPGQDATQDSLGDLPFTDLRDIVKNTAIRLGIPVP